MPQIGPLELLVVAAVALIVFGPHRLPDIARTIGKTLAELRRQADEIRTEFTTSLEEAPVHETGSKPSEDASPHGMEADPSAEPEESSAR